MLLSCRTDSLIVWVMMKIGTLASFGAYYWDFKIQDISLSQKRQPERRHEVFG